MDPYLDEAQLQLGYSLDRSRPAAAAFPPPGGWISTAVALIYERVACHGLVYSSLVVEVHLENVVVEKYLSKELVA